MKILQQEHASSRTSTVRDPEDTYGLQAHSTQSGGGVPFTMVIAPVSRVIFKQQAPRWMFSNCDA